MYQMSRLELGIPWNSWDFLRNIQGFPRYQKLHLDQVNIPLSVLHENTLELALSLLFT